MFTVAVVIDWIFRLLSIVVIVDVILSYFMAPYHPLRQALDRFLAPLLNPIRRALPATGPVDLSPVVLLLALLVVNRLIQGILR
jgi:YggT family protein